MKKTLLLSFLALTLAVPAFAGETFIRDGWPGEYPANFRVKKSVKVMSRSAPEISEKAVVECKLPRGAKYGPQQYGEGVYLSRFQIRKFKANKNLDLFAESQDEEAKGLVIKAGEEIEELAYWAEGFCQVRFQGKSFGMSCPGNGGSNDFSEIGEAREPSYEEWMNVKCGDLGRRWILLQDLAPAMDNGSLELIPFEG